MVITWEEEPSDQIKTNPILIAATNTVLVEKKGNYCRNSIFLQYYNELCIKCACVSHGMEKNY